MKTTYTGKLRLAGWEESIVESATSTTRIKYTISGESELNAQGSYGFYYHQQDKNNPLNSHATYSGFLVIPVIMDGTNEILLVKDEGEFRAGKARSNLVVISEKYQGLGFYQAGHDGGEFSLEVEKI